MRRRRDGSSDKDKCQDDVKESEDRRLSSRGERSKDGRHKDEKHKDGRSGDKHREDGDRANRQRDDKYRDDTETDSRHRDGDRDNRHREDKYREDGERDNRRRDDKYREDGDRDNRRRDDKYRGDGDRDARHRNDKYREDSDKGNRHKEDKYREDGDRDNRHRDDKYHKDGERDYRHRDDKYHEDGDRDDRLRELSYLEDGNSDGSRRPEKNREDVSNDSRHREGKQKDDGEKNKRFRDVKYRDERSSRDHGSDKSDIKSLREESNDAQFHQMKSNNRDASPIFDDRGTRYKDDKGRRRTSDKDDHSDIRSRSTKEQHLDSEKKSMSTARVESVSDRGRSYSRNVDVEIAQNHSRRRSSPSSSSHTAKEHYRHSKHEESKYREYAHEERDRHNGNKEYTGAAGATEKASLPRSIEKPFQKDDGHLVEFSAERRSRDDARTSPLPMVDKSPSSTSTDRRYLKRSNVRRSLDIEDSGQRSGGSMDAKDYSGRDGRGSRELPMDTLPGDELSQADGDTLSVSSPFSRTGHLSGRSLLPPPPPFRMDSPHGLGSLDDDNRGKSGNRHRRIGDPNIGRSHGSAWRGVPNWPPPMANGFLPFQHGPPPVGYHPVMPQFPAPIFPVRGSMELNQSGVPYHVHDGDRFSGRGHSLGWRNPVDDPRPPIHGWDPNNAVFGDESHIYRRLDWDHNRSGGQVWETSGDMWKGKSGGVSPELPAATQKEDYPARRLGDEVWPRKEQQELNDNEQLGVQVESIDINRSGDALERNTPEAPKTIPDERPNLPRKDDTLTSTFYLSMLDISADLTHPELYGQYTKLIGMDQNTNTEDDDSKFLLVEESVDATMKISNETSRASLFPMTNDSVLQKAMFLYKKTREDVTAVHGDKVAFPNVEKITSSLTLLVQEGVGSDNDKIGKVVPSSDQQEAEGVVSALNKVKIEDSPAITGEKIDIPVLGDGQEEPPDSSIAALNEVKLPMDSVSKQEGTLDYAVENNASSPKAVESQNVHSPIKVEDMHGATAAEGATDNETQKLHEGKCGTLVFPDLSTTTGSCEAVMMPESIESGSVNLSRIHQSPESTH
ncbi:uncharacterized protein LOC127812594 isoform X2 [Diospyros lotus]|nr:uncharacterized protein LOC127812594 isoform X2 [Diospyros lotus]